VILTAAFLLLAALVLFHVLSLAEETGKKQTTHAPTAQQATGNQHARQPVIRTAAFLLFAALVLFFLVSLAEEMGKKQTTQASTAQQAADSQLTDKLLLVSAALRFVIWTKVYVFVE
jgi:large-conductance mechanosensitive channel